MSRVLVQMVLVVIKIPSSLNTHWMTCKIYALGSTQVAYNHNKADSLAYCLNELRVTGFNGLERDSLYGALNGFFQEPVPCNGSLSPFACVINYVRMIFTANP